MVSLKPFAGCPGRRNALRERCSGKSVQGFLAFDFSDVLYLSGFPSEGCFILVSEAGDYLFAPKLLGEHARRLLESDGSLQVICENKLLPALERILKENRLKKIGYDSLKVTVALLRELEGIRHVRWEGLVQFVLSQRVVKDSFEIEAIEEACRITARSAKTVFQRLRVGQTEERTARVLEDLFFENGSRKPAFDTIVAFSEHTAYPHHVLTGKGLAKDSAVLMDCGSSLEGYKSDLTRTAFFGRIPPKFRKVYSIVRAAQKEGIASVREGVLAGEVDSVCRKIIGKAGFGDFFIHGTGHGVGLDIHEPPRLGMGSKEVLKEGMVVTVEPGIYLPGEFGVRIEDTVLVTGKGCRILTNDNNR